MTNGPSRRSSDPSLRRLHHGPPRAIAISYFPVQVGQTTIQVPRSDTQLSIGFEEFNRLGKHPSSLKYVGKLSASLNPLFGITIAKQDQPVLCGIVIIGESWRGCHHRGAP